MIWWSERSGWGHFYLYDRDGKLKNAITSGAWRASRIVDVDAKNRLLYFLGNAREPGENVYYQHLYSREARRHRPDAARPGRRPITAVHHPGCTTRRLSPSKKFVVDNCSRVDHAPVAIAPRRHGQEVMKLEKTDLSRLQGDRLEAAGDVHRQGGGRRDGPVRQHVEAVRLRPEEEVPDHRPRLPRPAAGGRDAHVRGVQHATCSWRSSGSSSSRSATAAARRTRSKAYHSYGYFNLRDYGLADKKAAIEQLAARHPCIDIERVGIYGHSGGGFMSAAAVLQKPYNEFFKAAVASAGNHDNNIYNNYWSERYHGLKEVAGRARTSRSRPGPARRTGGRGPHPPADRGRAGRARPETAPRSKRQTPRQREAAESKGRVEGRRRTKPTAAEDASSRSRCRRTRSWRRT